MRSSSGDEYSRECNVVPPNGWRCTRGYHSAGPCRPERTAGFTIAAEENFQAYLSKSPKFQVPQRGIEFGPAEWGTITHCVIYGDFRRTWRERLFTRPWSPWVATARKDLWRGPIGPIELL